MVLQVGFIWQTCKTMSFSFLVVSFPLHCYSALSENKRLHIVKKRRQTKKKKKTRKKSKARIRAEILKHKIDWKTGKAEKKTKRQVKHTTKDLENFTIRGVGFPRVKITISPNRIFITSDCEPTFQWFCFVFGTISKG